MCHRKHRAYCSLLCYYLKKMIKSSAWLAIFFLSLTDSFKTLASFANSVIWLILVLYITHNNSKTLIYLHLILHTCIMLLLFTLDISSCHALISACALLFFDRLIKLTRRLNQQNVLEKANMNNKNNSLALAKLAHELKNPILTMTQLSNEIFEHIEDPSSSDDDELIYDKDLLTARKSKDVMKALCEYILILIEDINDFSKMEFQEHGTHCANEEIEIVPIINFCFLIFKIRQQNEPSKQNIHISLDINPEIPSKVYGHEMKIKQVLINLLSNAYKFTTSGYVKIILKSEYTNTVRVIVSDTGHGLSDSEKNMLFTPFSSIERNQQFNSRGCGLGLLIVKELLSQMRSEIKFNSEKDKGSQFWFDLNCPRQQVVENENGSAGSTIKIDDAHNINYSETIANLMRYVREKNSTSSVNSNITHGCNKSFNNGQKNVIIEANNEDNDIYIIENENENESERQNIQDLANQAFMVNSLARLSPSNRSLRRYSKKKLTCKAGNTYSKTLKVIVCDDDQIQVTSTKNVISKACQNFHVNSEVQSAFNGIECLYLIYKESQKGTSYDLLLIDEEMPWLKGSIVIDNLNRLIEEKNLDSMEMYLVTSHRMCDVDLPGKYKEKIISKPVTLEKIQDIVMNLSSTCMQL